MALGGVEGGCGKLSVSWGSVLGWLWALPLWSLGAKVVLGGQFPLSPMDCLQVICKKLSFPRISMESLCSPCTKRDK